MEVGVRVSAEHSHTGESRHVVSAYFTFVALGDDGKPLPVPPVIPESDAEKKRFADAAHRREQRVALRARQRS